jgi:hypothetical protein
VQRPDGARSLRLVAVAFGVTVVVTRLYLELSGYPQIGGGQYHLAHALWGGLLLLVGGLLALLWGNRWVHPVTAVCVGAGSGLFVDEVGKFITARNDYFTPLAAPIIYVAFLAVLAVAVLARRVPMHDPRTVAYTVAVQLKELADGPLRPASRDELLRGITALEAEGSPPDLRELGARLRPVVAEAPVAQPPDRLPRVRAALSTLERALFPRWVHRLALIAGAGVVGLLSLIGLVVLVALASGDPDVRIVLDGETPTDIRSPALFVASAGETAVGALLLLSAVLLVLGRDRLGVRIGRVGLVLGLAGVNVALGYIDAELVVAVVVLELALLGLYHRYRSRFLVVEAPAPDAPGGEHGHPAGVPQCGQNGVP